MDFRKIVVCAAAFILLCTLVMIGRAMSNQKKETIYPPVLPECPDYWEASDGECSRGRVYNRGDCDEGTVDFSLFNNCAKYEWSNDCKVQWDGISNNPDLCDTTAD